MLQCQLSHLLDAQQCAEFAQGCFTLGDGGMLLRQTVKIRKNHVNVIIKDEEIICVTILLQRQVVSNLLKMRKSLRDF